MKATKLPFEFGAGFNELEFAHVPVQETLDFSLPRQCPMLSIMFGMGSLIYTLEPISRVTPIDQIGKELRAAAAWG